MGTPRRTNRRKHTGETMQTTTTDPRMGKPAPRHTYLSPKDRKQLEDVLALVNAIHGVAEANAWALPHERDKLLRMLEIIGNAAGDAGHTLERFLSDD